MPMHLCLRAGFRLCACAQVGTGCQLVQSFSRIPIPTWSEAASGSFISSSPDTSIWWSTALRAGVFITIFHVWFNGLSKVSYFNFALVKMITKFIPSRVVYSQLLMDDFYGLLFDH